MYSKVLSGDADVATVSLSLLYGAKTRKVWKGNAFLRSLLSKRPILNIATLSVFTSFQASRAGVSRGCHKNSASSWTFPSSYVWSPLFPSPPSSLQPMFWGGHTSLQLVGKRLQVASARFKNCKSCFRRNRRRWVCVLGNWCKHESCSHSPSLHPWFFSPSLNHFLLLSLLSLSLTLSLLSPLLSHKHTPLLSPPFS